MGQTGVDGVYAPLEAIFFGMAFPGLHPAARLDQIIKAALLAPAARVYADGANAHFVGQVNAAQRVVNVLLALCCIFPHKILVNAQVINVQPQLECLPLNALHIAVLFAFHLAMQQLHAVQTQCVRLLQHIGDGRLLWRKMPIGIRGGAESEGWGCGHWVILCGIYDF